MREKKAFEKSLFPQDKGKVHLFFKQVTLQYLIGCHFQ